MISRVLLWLVLSCTASKVTLAEAGIDRPDHSNRNGEQIYKQACYACHGTGLNNAPVRGDSYAWAERLEKGKAVLLENTLSGINSMPPRGGCLTCTDADISAAVNYLLGN